MKHSWTSSNQEPYTQGDSRTLLYIAPYHYFEYITYFKHFYIIIISRNDSLIDKSDGWRIRGACNGTLMFIYFKNIADAKGKKNYIISLYIHIRKHFHIRESISMSFVTKWIQWFFYLIRFKFFLIVMYKLK